MSYNPKDRFFKAAKEQNFAARSVFKLKEIAERHRILKKGDRVLDLGCSPGSWSQFASQVVGEDGLVIGIDLTTMKITLPNAQFICGDIFAVDNQALIASQGPYDVVLSDMAPKTTGIRSVDQARSLALCEAALDEATKHLRLGGHFVCKFFHSDDFKELQAKIKKQFQKVDAMRPESTRTQSKEIFLIGIGKKG